MKAPFPWHGGKSRHAKRIWQELGDPKVYAEPFAGSLAVLLNRPPSAHGNLREVVCDKDANIVNFWRAMQAAPENVARWADWPTFHHDLNARHRWIQETNAERAERIRADMDYFDPKAAGVWAWGVSNWIGGGFGTKAVLKKDGDPWDEQSYVHKQGVKAGAEPVDFVPVIRRGQGAQVQVRNTQPHAGNDSHTGAPSAQGLQMGRLLSAVPRDFVPKMNDHPAGYGAQVQVQDKRPEMSEHLKGRGVQPQVRNGQAPGVPRNTQPQAGNDGHTGSPTARGVAMGRLMTDVPRDGMPKVINDWRGGTGVNMQRRDASPSADRWQAGERLLSWFYQLQRRLLKVYVLDRDWTSAVTRTVLCDTPSAPAPSIAVFLDPPYRTDTGRADTLYAGDDAATDVAKDAYTWAVEHGDRYRIAYAMHSGDFPVPPGWRSFDQSIRSASGHSDRIIFSPTCAGGDQGRLL